MSGNKRTLEYTRVSDTTSSSFTFPDEIAIDSSGFSASIEVDDRHILKFTDRNDVNWLSSYEVLSKNNSEITLALIKNEDE